MDLLVIKSNAENIKTLFSKVWTLGGKTTHNPRLMYCGNVREFMGSFYIKMGTNEIGVPMISYNSFRYKNTDDVYQACPPEVYVPNQFDVLYHSYLDDKEEQTKATWPQFLSSSLRDPATFRYSQAVRLF